MTKTISFPATISNNPFAAQAEFSINRKDFGMKFDGKADNLIRDGVVLQIELKAK
jgi:polyisoprenoid-binding protein YceI